MRDSKTKFDEEYQKNLEKQNSAPYFESKFPNKKPSRKIMVSLITLAFALVFFVIIFCIFTAVNIENTNTLTVTMYYYEGKVENKPLGKDEVFLVPSNPEREGYKFLGWYQDENYTKIFDSTVKLKKDTTIYAKWEIKSYIVNFYIGNKTFTQEYGTLFTIPDNSYFGVEGLQGWTTEHESLEIKYRQGDSFNMPAYDINLYPVM